MPVYGVVNTVNKDAAGNETVENGYLAILENGAALTTLKAYAGGAKHKYATAYSSFAPYSYDEYDLQEAVSVGGAKSYLVVAETRYEGSYRTRYVMLSDPDYVAQGKGKYVASYVGMASCYRDYLEQNCDLDMISEVASNLPLYIEVLGSMKVTKRILTFPVSVSTPLTTFEDIQTMYKELSAEGVDNVNFKLTGFTNGGMYYTYPAKVRWERSLGGKKGFNALLEYANSVNKSGTDNLGIYPDFDFQYINNSALFDRVRNGVHAAKMVDNRYASKQVYNSVSGLYDTLYAILISSDKLASLYERFIKDYEKYDVKGISVSTLGSDLNSNFDDDKYINRDAARSDVSAILKSMSSKYSVMTDVGNSYTYEFIDHIVNASIDSSHFGFSSYAVPFLGMVLHGYISYAGTPLNYTGSIDYNILHSIENGASLYYILCMQNSNYLKEDEKLSKYYGVDYKNWFDSIVESQERLNGAIGDLQKFQIVDHQALKAERVPNSSERIEDLENLLTEYAEQADKMISEAVGIKLAEMRADSSYIGKGLCVEIDRNDLISAACDKFKYAGETITDEMLSEYGFIAMIDSLVAKYSVMYPEKDGAVKITFNSKGCDLNGDGAYTNESTDVLFDYTSKYSCNTDSVANANGYYDEVTNPDGYVATDYTCDNGNVVMVVYKDTNAKSKTYGKTVVFLINYNSYDVKITIDKTIDSSLDVGETRVVTVERLDFVAIGKEVK